MISFISENYSDQYQIGQSSMNDATSTIVEPMHKSGLTSISRALKPGGWIDCSEPGLYFESYYDTLEPDHCYKQWGTAMLEAGEKAGMTFDVGPYMKQRLIDAGFVNVEEKRFCCTIGKWSTDPWEREVGLWEQFRLVQGCQDFCERRFINQLGVRLLTPVTGLC